jgi:hypothetical protein
MSFARKYIELEIITLNETSWTQTNTSYFHIPNLVFKKRHENRRGTIWEEEGRPMGGDRRE